VKTNILFCYHNGKTRILQNEREGVAALRGTVQVGAGGRCVCRRENEVRHRDCRSTDGTSVYLPYIYITGAYSQFQSSVIVNIGGTKKRESERETTMTEYARAHGHSKCV